jgi:hypothetical protein
VELKRLLGAAPINLEAAVCSHELLMVVPNRWDLATRTVLRPLRRRGFLPLSLGDEEEAREGRRGAERQRGECADGRDREGMSLGGPE